MGRNNDRSPSYPLKITTNPDKFTKLNQQIFDAWFETWLTVHVPNLMHRPKWFQNDKDVQIGDIVLFTKRDSSIANVYQFGMVKELEHSADGKIRKVMVEYQNSNESVKRVTHRAVRSLVMIHPVDELSVWEELSLSESKK